MLFRSGFAVTVPSGHPEVQHRAHYVTKNPGGRGAVREVCDLVMRAQGTYDQALAPADIAASFNAGPDATFPVPVAQPDAITMNYGTKALVAVLANDSGSGLPLQPATVTVVTPPQFGTATPDGAGRILYTHATGTPASDSFTYRVSKIGRAHV